MTDITILNRHPGQQPSRSLSQHRCLSTPAWMMWMRDSISGPGARAVGRSPFTNATPLESPVSSLSTMGPMQVGTVCFGVEVLPEVRGKGIGRALLLWARACSERLVISATPSAAPFYAALLPHAQRVDDLFVFDAERIAAPGLYELVVAQERIHEPERHQQTDADWAR